MNKRKKSIRCPKFTDEQLEWLNIRFNKHHDTPMQICKKYEKYFGIKFPVYPKTLHNYVRLGLLGLLKENLFNHGRKNKTKNWKDNCGKLYKFRSILDIENKESNVGWFEMDTVVGKDHQSSYLVLTEQNSINYFVMKLKENSSSEVLEKLEELVKINCLVGKIKSIITDQGKEFSKFKEMEKIADANVYYCDAGTPTQKPLIERKNQEFRHWYPLREQILIIILNKK